METLTADVISYFLSFLKPKRVLPFCGLTRYIHGICKSPKVFELLMREHYPQYVLTDNPKEQYIAITNKYQTTYRFMRQGINELYYEFRQPPERIGLTQRAEATPDWSLCNLPYSTRAKILKESVVEEYVKEKNLIVVYQNLLFEVKIWHQIRYAWPPREDGPIRQQQIDDNSKSFFKILQFNLFSGFKPRMRDAARSDEYFIRNDSEIIASLYGRPIPTGTEMWISITWQYGYDDTYGYRLPEDYSNQYGGDVGDGYQMQNTIQIYKTKELAIRHFIRDFYYEIVTNIMDNLKFSKYIVKMENFGLEHYQNICRKCETKPKSILLIPNSIFENAMKYAGMTVINSFTKDNIYNHCMEHNKFKQFIDRVGEFDSEFRKITF